MAIRSLLFASIALTAVSLVVPSRGLSLEYAGLTDDIGSASVSILDKLGYDCTTAAVGIVCKKCQVEDNKQKCVAYLCDAVSKKCRKKSAEIPQLPSLNRNNIDRIIPSTKRLS